MVETAFKGKCGAVAVIQKKEDCDAIRLHCPLCKETHDFNKHKK